MTRMPEPRTQEQRHEVKEFVDLLFSYSGYETQAAFAEAAGFDEGSVSGWRRAKNMPDGYNMVRLIKAAGILGGQRIPALPASALTVLARVEEMLRDVQEDPLLLSLLGEPLRAAADALQRAIAHSL